MTAYAKGNKAVGLCQRCGDKKKLHELRPDGENDLLVCGDCYDIYHPAKRPVRTDDAIALRRPAPDLDAEASREIPAQFDEPLVDSLGWSSGTYFGGGT